MKGKKTVHIFTSQYKSEATSVDCIVCGYLLSHAITWSMLLLQLGNCWQSLTRGGGASIKCWQSWQRGGGWSGKCWQSLTRGDKLHVPRGIPYYYHYGLVTKLNLFLNKYFFYIFLVRKRLRLGKGGVAKCWHRWQRGEIIYYYIPLISIKNIIYNWKIRWKTSDWPWPLKITKCLELTKLSLR